MTEYSFSVIVKAPELSHEEILDATDALAAAGCTDASLRGHRDGAELLFDRAAPSLQAAMTSAIADVERAGFEVSRVELEREALRAA